MDSLKLNGVHNGDHDNNNNNKAVYRIPDLILKKRNGEELSEDEIKYFIKAVSNTDENNNSIQPSQIGVNLIFFIIMFQKCIIKLLDLYFFEFFF